VIDIKNLRASVDDKEILKGLNLKIGKGEVHAIMGPNGSGKSTLSYVLSGKEGYNVSGEIQFNKKNLLELNAEERAREGIFLAFQYPIEIPGVFTNNFLRTSLNSVRKANGKVELNAIDFLKIIKEKAKELNIGEEMLLRPLNVGFSGGEKKRNEILQMSLLEPSFVVMDETDSGLDIDALKIVSNGVNSLRDPERSFLIITHYQRLLNYIKPDFVHVLSEGKIVKTGDWKLALDLEDQGYGQFIN
jgi:FeS assembly ATPase SufC